MQRSRQDCFFLSQPWIAPPALVGRASHLLCVFLSSSCKSRLKVIDFFLFFLLMFYVSAHLPFGDDGYA